jgi:integrase
MAVEQFCHFVEAVQDGAGWCSRECADLVQFMAYGGFRKNEAANVVWGDCDFERREIRVRVTKSGEPRIVPIVPDMEALLLRIRAARATEPPDSKVMLVHECQKAMDRAARGVGMARITHHDLRHLFATRCIEAGVDIPTVSRWLGHKDGGALAMRVYGHLRNHHSQEMARKVKF